VRALALGLAAAGVLSACTDDSPAPPVTGETVPVDDYVGLSEDATWTWRDDGLTTELVFEELLRGHHQGEGLVALRRGERWGDAEEVGHLQWDVAGGLTLSSWVLGDIEGETTVPLLGAGAEWGDTVEQDDWICTNSKATEIDTWYGVFEDGLVVSCEGGAGLEGTYSFALDRGLVLFQGTLFSLDLVSAGF